MLNSSFNFTYLDSYQNSMHMTQKSYILKGQKRQMHPTWKSAGDLWAWASRTAKQKKITNGGVKEERIKLRRGGGQSDWGGCRGLPANWCPHTASQLTHFNYKLAEHRGNGDVLPNPPKQNPSSQTLPLSTVPLPRHAAPPPAGMFTVNMDQLIRLAIGSFLIVRVGFTYSRCTWATASDAFVDSDAN